MPVFKLRNAGALGIVHDDEAHDLPAQNGGPLAWSNGDNIRFRDGYVERHKGWKQFVAPSITPYGALAYPEISGDYYWVYPGLAKCYAYDGTSHYNITRQTAAVDVDYTGDADNKWQGGIFGNVLVLNNGIDVPQYWPLPVSSSANLADLANWNAAWTTRVIVPFRSFLVAGDVTKSGTRYPTLIKWSNQADPGTVPTSWDETDAGEPTGEFPVGSEAGTIVDLVPLRDELLIYKEESVWGMSWVGGAPVFSFRRALRSRGLLAKGQAIEFFGRHLMVTHGDVLVHDGQNEESILKKRWREILFTLIDKDNASRGFLVPLYRQDEVWYCFPEEGETIPNRALVWNYKENTLGIRDIPLSPGAGIGIVGLGGGARLWSDDVNLTWDQADFTWNDRAFDPLDRSPVFANASYLYNLDRTNLKDASAFRAWIERVGVNLTDDLTVSTITEIHPRMVGAADFYIGSQMHPDDTVDWSGPYSFDSETDRKIDCFVTGVYHSLRVESTDDAMWRLNGMNITHVPAGLR